jgi:hypothetical protein
MLMEILSGLRRAILYIGDPQRVRAVADLLSAVAALLWPVVLLLLLFSFRREFVRFIRRLKKARLFGQEVELGDELRELQRSVVEAQEETEAAPPLPGPVPPAAGIQLPAGFDEEIEVLNVAAQSPTAGLMLLSSLVERRVDALIQRFAPGGGSTAVRLRQADKELTSLGHLPSSLTRSVDSFLHVRSRVVHGGEASADEVLRAIDVGLRLLRTLRAVSPEQG